MSELDKIKELADKYGATIEIRYSECEGLWHCTIHSYSSIGSLEIKRIKSHTDLLDYIEKDIEELFNNG